MNTNEAKQWAVIFNAIAERKTIQVKNAGVWVDVDIDDYNYLDGTSDEYRIKPELKYRPFKSMKECIDEMRKHEPFGLLVNCYTGNYGMVVSIYSSTINVFDTIYTFNEVMKEGLIFVDGAPFGVNTDSE